MSTSARKSIGSFGASARELDWGRNAASARGAPDNGPTSAETATIPSSFASARGSHRAKGPSSAMGGGSRFAPTKAANSGDFYVPPALGDSKSHNGNRRQSTGTMGSAKRFGEVKVCAPGDYSDAKPGAFASAKKKTAQNTGFGGTSSRVSAFAEAAKKAEESASAHLTYDGALAQTGAFAKVDASKSSSAFASKSSQRTHVAVADGPGAQAYNTAGVGSIAAGANRSFNKSLQQGTGGFGTSARRTSEIMSARGADAPGPGEYAPDISDGPTERAKSARPSSAFASTTRVGGAHLRKSESNGLTYDAHSADGMATVATKTFNKKETGTMGATRRFAPNKESAPGPGDYSDARPGAFTKSQGSSKMNTGFGGTSSRVSAFAEAAKKAEESASSHLTYDGALAQTGAFAKTVDTSKSSAAFASKSSQRTHVAVADGPGAQAYNTASVGSISSSANRSFNKSLQQGTGGFGTSARRTSQIMSARGADAPGPGEYAPDISDGAAQSARPSSAFASTTRKGETHLRKSESNGLSYDAHSADGMATVATKTFNKKETGTMGATRRFEAAKDTPGPGEYAHESVPTKSGRAKPTGSFASTTLRDSTQWNTPGAGGFSSFLP